MGFAQNASAPSIAGRQCNGLHQTIGTASSTMYAFRIILLWNYYTILVYLTKGGGGVHLGFKKPSFLAPKLKTTAKQADTWMKRRIKP